ncbi:MAG: hypothetical protein P8Z37_14610 [Acidobacteriota bacterium]
MHLKSDLDIQESTEHVKVVVRTPNGTWPTEGFFEVPIYQKVARLLEHARSSLKLKETGQWAVKAQSEHLNPALSYEENGLAGHVFIDYKPNSP